MKKFLILTALALSLLAGVKGVEAKTLYQCFQEKGIAWSGVSNRALEAAKNGVWKYRGTAEQNKLLTSRMCEDSDLLGFSVITDYNSTLNLPMTATQATVPVSSLVTKDLHTITIADLGGIVFLTIEPGGSKEELVKCTGITGSAFSGCTRGLAFYGTSTAAVPANQKTHNPGSRVVMSNAHYVYEQFVDVNSKNQEIQGLKTFTSGTIYITSSSFGLRVSGGQLQWSIDGFVNSYNFTSSSISQLSASSTAGIGVTNSQIHLIVSTTLGMAFGPDGRLYQKTSSTLGVENDSNGIKINTTTLVSLFATGTPAAYQVPIANISSTVDAWVSFPSSSAFAPNTYPTENSWNTSIITMIPNTTPAAAANQTNGWFNMEASRAGADTVRKLGNVASTTFQGIQAYTTLLPGTSSLFAQFGNPLATRVKFRMKIDNMVAGNQVAIGFAPVNTNLENASTTLTTPQHVFQISGRGVGTTGLLNTYTSGGASATKNIITGIDTNDWHTYEIITYLTAVEFWVDGQMKFTHTTNLTTSGSLLFGFANLVGTPRIAITDPVISQKL